MTAALPKGRLIRINPDRVNADVCRSLEIRHRLQSHKFFPEKAFHPPDTPQLPLTGCPFRTYTPRPFPRPM